MCGDLKETPTTKTALSLSPAPSSSFGWRRTWWLHRPCIDSPSLSCPCLFATVGSCDSPSGGGSACLHSVADLCCLDGASVLFEEVHPGLSLSKIATKSALNLFVERAAGKVIDLFRRCPVAGWPVSGGWCLVTGVRWPVAGGWWPVANGYYKYEYCGLFLGHRT